MDLSLRSLARQIVPQFVRRRRALGRLAHDVAISGEPELVELHRFAAAGDLCLDVGASVGVYAYALERLGCRVVAFEPNPAVAPYTEFLSSDAVEVRRIALAATDGEAVLTVAGDSGEGTLRHDAFDTQPTTATRVTTRRLDGLDLGRIAFIKIDVEGFEEAVLAGAAATVARDRPVLLIEIEERHNPGGLARIAAQLGGLDYRCAFLHDGEWKPVAAFDAERHQRLDALAPMLTGGGRRACAYYNNFVFLPAGRTVPGLH